MPLSNQLEALYYLKRDRSSGYEKPYKPALLLALIDEVADGLSPDNRFTLSDQLIKRYREILGIVAGANDHARIHYPFWHLCGDDVWMCYRRNGQPLYVPGTNAASSPSVKWIRENMTHASLEPELFALLQQSDSRELIRQSLIDRYFPIQRDLLQALRHQQGEAKRVAEEPTGYNTDPARTAAFAKTIKTVYDYRCAASGLRFRFRELTIVDACHLIPFSESHNDHPTNGIALSKNHHWAFDRHLISPAPGRSGLEWKVSPLLDDRIEGHRDLIKLDGRSALLPKITKFHPAESSIAWRMERLLA